MKLIDILVEELPKRGGWPEGVSKISSTSCGRVFFDGQSPHGFTLPVASDAWDSHKHPFSYTNAVTREQYEAALAAKNDGWINWGGGECPVSASEMVDVIFGHGGRMSANIADCWRWSHDGTDSDIIAYRLHQLKEVEQTEAEQESALNECIGQDTAPVWNGEGLPPVGMEIEYSFAKVRYRTDFSRGKVLAYGMQNVFMEHWASKNEFIQPLDKIEFRPIRSEAEQKREKAIAKITDAICGEIPDTGMATAAKYAARAYDAIAAGKITGVKLED